MSHTPLLSPEEELVLLKSVYGENNYKAIFQRLFTSFDVLQTRSQMLLGLTTICLTVTGFSGPQIARSSLFSRFSICAGLALVLLAALVVLAGPLQLRWGTQTRSDSLDHSVLALIHRRNSRTRKYHFASALLILGISGYVASLLAYLLFG